MRAGLFEHWQAEYAERHVATFPVRPDKTPGVRGYLKVGSKASEQLAITFADAAGIGLACKRNKITVLDVDTTDERVLADGLIRYGDTPFVVRSGSGHFQAWYRHNGEGRRIRPDPAVPVDILGDGFVVAPPSQTANGVYRIIRGSLDDLPTLPRMSVPDKSRASLETDASEPPPDKLAEACIPVGKRNDALWRHCMAIVRDCKSLEELVNRAAEFNNTAFSEPLPLKEVLQAASSAMEKELLGQNWFGRGKRVVLPFDVVDSLAAGDPKAFALYTLLRRHHAGADDFIVAASYAKTLKWDERALRSARSTLVSRGLIVCIHPGGRGVGDPPHFRFSP